MSLFDKVRCDHPLPRTGYGLPEGHRGWQTKSFFDPSMDLYVITKDGRLLREERKMEWRRDPERRLGRYLKTVESWMVEVDFHGVLNFYDSFLLPDGKRLWAEFDAYYTRGRLEEIEVKGLYEQEEVSTNVRYVGEGLEVEREDEPPEDLPRRARLDNENL